MSSGSTPLQPPREPVTLANAIHQLSRSRTLEHVTSVVRTVARELVGADGVSFVVREGDRCFYVEEDAVGPLWKGQRFPLEQCVSGWVMANRMPVVIPDIYADPRVPADAYRPTFVRSMAMVPVGLEQPIGAIGAYWASHHEATPNQLDVLKALADSAALALEDAAGTPPTNR